MLYINIIIFVCIHFNCIQWFVHINKNHGVGSLWTEIPQTVLFHGWGETVFLYYYYFSNATQLGCIFAEHCFQMGNTHVFIK